MARGAIVNKQGIAIWVGEAASGYDDNYSHEGAFVPDEIVNVGDTWTKGGGFVYQKATITESQFRLAMAQFGLSPEGIEEIVKIASSM